MGENIIGKNLEALRKDRNITQEKLGQLAGVSTASVSYWENGWKVPRKTSIKKLCGILNCSEVDITGYSDGFYRKASGLSSITATPSQTSAPVLGNVAAGEPREAIEQSDEQHYCPPHLLERYPDGFFLRVSGDSMNNVLPEGCYAFVAPEEPVSGNIYAVKVNGDDATIKRLKLLDDIVVLEPDSTNPEHRKMIIDRDNPDAPSFRCLGRIVWYDVSL